MEITQGNLAAVFTGLDARFKRAAANVAVPNTGRIVRQADGVSREDKYPMSGLLGDLVPLTDELYMENIWMLIQEAKPIVFAEGIWIMRLDVLNDKLGVYNGPIEELAILGRTHPFRNVAPTLQAGFTTVWVPDGAMTYADLHTWPGGVPWDNLEHLPLTAGNFDIACLHLEQRPGPSGQPMGLSPKLLVVGPSNRAAAETILNLLLIAGGMSNRQYQRCDLLVLPRIANDNWFVIDDDPYNVGKLPGKQGETGTVPETGGIKPLLLDLREDLRTASQTSGESDEVFERERYRYKAAITYVLLIIAPWLIQASNPPEEETTTTTTPSQ